jgi:hypothetical protein
MYEHASGVLRIVDLQLRHTVEITIGDNRSSLLQKMNISDRTSNGTLRIGAIQARCCFGSRSRLTMRSCGSTTAAASSASIWRIDSLVRRVSSGDGMVSLFTGCHIFGMCIGCVALRVSSAARERDVSDGGENPSYLQCGGCQRRPAGSREAVCQPLPGAEAKQRSTPTQDRCGLGN